LYFKIDETCEVKLANLAYRYAGVLDEKNVAVERVKFLESLIATGLEEKFNILRSEIQEKYKIEIYKIRNMFFSF